MNTGAYSSWAIPTQLEYVKDSVLNRGEFGSPNYCPVSNKLFISRGNVGSDSKFQSILSIFLTAFTAQKQIRLRSDYCSSVAFHGQEDSESRIAIYIK